MNELTDMNGKPLKIIHNEGTIECSDPKTARDLCDTILRDELFEFTHPIPQPANLHRPVCDHGITHFCLQVESIDVAYTKLQEAGVLLHCEPKLFGNMKALYARDPDGNVFELLECCPCNGKFMKLMTGFKMANNNGLTPAEIKGYQNDEQ